MAADWFPMGLYRSRCPEVVRVSSATGRTPHEVLGLLCDLWSWATSETADGQVGGVRLVHLSSVVGADEAFWRAVAEVNWLTEDERGLVVPNWDHWLSESAKKRARDVIRKRVARLNSPQSVRGASAKRPPAKRTKRGLQKTEDSTQKTEHKEPSLPFLSDAFRETWERWKKFRREKKKPLTETTVEEQFAELGKLTESHAIATLKRSIANGWTGLFPESAKPAAEPAKAKYWTKPMFTEDSGGPTDGGQPK